MSVLVFASASCRRSPPPPDSNATPPEDAAVADWCAEGYLPIAGEGCFAAPPNARPGTPLIVYLHGMYEPNAAADEMDRQKRVAARATKRGFAVLAFRSKEGVCHPDSPEYAHKFCWPSNEQSAERASAFVASWKRALDEVDKKVGAGPRYVLGFSSGGFFAGLLAVRALYPADAFVIAHGGPVEPVRAVGKKPPLLLLSADDDVAQDGMIRLQEELTLDGWPHDPYAREGGHGLPDSDIDHALTFFGRVRAEKVPLDPPLSAHRPHLHDRDAGGSSATPSLSEAGAGLGD